MAGVVRYKLCQILRWQLVQTMQEQIWRSWSKDYLHSLQNRGKSHNRMHWIMAWLLLDVCCSPLLSGSGLESCKSILIRMAMSTAYLIFNNSTVLNKRPIAQICKTSGTGRAQCVRTLNVTAYVFTESNYVFYYIIWLMSIILLYVYFCQRN